MRAVLPLDSSLPLRRTGRDHRDPQLRAHAPKLRDRLFSSQLLLHRGRTFVHILPIHVHRLRHPRSVPSRRAMHPPPPRSSLARPVAPTSCWSRRRPNRSSSPAGPAPPAKRENCRPSAPSLQNALGARGGEDAAAVSAPDSTTLPSASTAAAFRQESSVRPPTPSVRPPASAQIARPPLRRTFPAPAAAPAVDTSRRERDSSFLPHCGASAPQLLPPDTASTAASLAGSSRATIDRHPRPAVVCCAPAPVPPLVPTPFCSSVSAPI